MTQCLTIPCTRESAAGIDYCCVGCSRSVRGEDKITHSERCEKAQEQRDARG